MKACPGAPLRTVDAASDANGSVGSVDNRPRQAPYLRFAPSSPMKHPDIQPAVVAFMVHARENSLGNLELAAVLDFSISISPLGNDFEQLCGNQGNRHFHMSTISTPYGGRACPKAFVEKGASVFVNWTARFGSRIGSGLSRVGV